MFSSGRQSCQWAAIFSPVFFRSLSTVVVDMRPAYSSKLTRCVYVEGLGGGGARGLETINIFFKIAKTSVGCRLKKKKKEEEEEEKNGAIFRLRRKR